MADNVDILQVGDVLIQEPGRFGSMAVGRVVVVQRCTKTKALVIHQESGEILEVGRTAINYENTLFYPKV